jgi:alkanesulfonate monooxygenase SsuD/methylene tetrahydromethanopterin reductase-like flavin-dependent oxidoreductase (luciferase family)
VERASYMLTSVDRDPQKAVDTVRDYYFFVYQLSEVVRPEVLAPYGVTEETLQPMKEAYKKGNLVDAKRLIPDEAIEALTVSGSRDHALDRIEEYRKAGVTLPILMPIGNVDFATTSLATS